MVIDRHHAFPARLTVRMLLIRVVEEKTLPFAHKIPNATTIAAMRSIDNGKGKRLAPAKELFEDLGI